MLLPHPLRHNSSFLLQHHHHQHPIRGARSSQLPLGRPPRQPWKPEPAPARPAACCSCALARGFHVHEPGGRHPSGQAGQAAAPFRNTASQTHARRTAVHTHAILGPGLYSSTASSLSASAMPHIPLITLFMAALLPVLKVALMCSLGAYASLKGLLTLEGRRVLSTLIFHIFTPCLFASKLGAGVGIIEAARMWPITFNMMATHVLGYLLGLVVVRVVRPPTELTKHIIIANTVGNTGNLPLVLVASLGSDPALATLYGQADAGLGYVILGSLSASFVQFPLVNALLRKPTPAAAPEGGGGAAAHGKQGAGEGGKEGKGADAEGDVEDGVELGRVGSKARPLLASFASSTGSDAVSTNSSGALLGLPSSQSMRRISSASAARLPSVLEAQEGEEGGQGAKDGALEGSAAAGRRGATQPNGDQGLSGLEEDGENARLLGGVRGASDAPLQQPPLPLSRLALLSSGPHGAAAAPSAPAFLYEEEEDGEEVGGLSTPVARMSEAQRRRMLATALSGRGVMLQGGSVTFGRSGTSGLSSTSGEEEGEGGGAGGPVGSGARTTGNGGEGPALVAAPAQPLSPAQMLLVRARRLWKRHHGIVTAVVSPPTIACVVGILIASVPALQHAFFSNRGGLRLFGEVANALGDCTIPVLMLVLGANLSRGPGVSKVPLRVIIGTVISRLLVLPLLGTGLVLSLQAMGALSSTPPMAIIVMLITHSAPTAIIVHAIATMNSNREDDVAALLFWEYLASAVTLPLLIALYLVLVA